MPSARNTKSTAGESEDTSSDGNGGERPFPTLAHWPSAVLCGTPSAKVGAFFAIFTPTFWRHRPCTTFYGIPPSKVGVFMAISSPTFRKRCPYTALCGTPPAKVWVFFALFTPTFGKRQAPAPLSFRLQKFTLRPSSRPAVHHSAVFCTERSRECLAYRKMPVFCTACIRKRLAYNRRPLFCTGRRIASRL